MTKSAKRIVLTFFIGCLVVVVGNIFGRKFDYENVNEFILDFLFNQLYTFVIGFSCLAYFNYIKKLKFDKYENIKLIVYGIIGTTIVTLICIFFLRIFVEVLIFGTPFETFIYNESWQGYSFGLWITLTIISVFYIIFFYSRYQKNKIKEQKIIAGTASAQFNALKNQLDPHFLFNSLNVLTSLIDENPEAAQNFTTSLSKVYRYVLEQKDKELISVDEELKFARTYVRLLKMRFEDSIVFEIPDSATNPEARVVPLSLQLLLENAVKHNIVTSYKPLKIRIFEKAGNLIVENILQPKEVLKNSTGVGLANIKQRYSLLTSRRVEINKTVSHFSVALPMLTKQISVMNGHTQTQESYIEDKRYEKARKRVQAIKRFYSNLLSYAIVIPVLAFINLKTTNFPWVVFPALGWGFGVLAHGMEAYGYSPFTGPKWEERKIREFMEKEESKNR